MEPTMQKRQLGKSRLEVSVPATDCGYSANSFNIIKSLLLTALLISILISQNSCRESSTELDTPSTSPSGGEERILIVYLSRTENTKAVAEIIQQRVGGDMVQLELETPYPDNYQEIVAQVDRENETGYLPPLKTRIHDLKDYDTVFLGFPTWDMQLPPPMKSFLHQHDLSGKTVIPFNTHGGYGKGSSFKTVAEMSPNAEVLEGFSTEGGRERDGIFLAITGERRDEVRNQVAQWLKDIGIGKP
jgi:flavodoxin